MLQRFSKTEIQSLKLESKKLYFEANDSRKDIDLGWVKFG